MTHTNQLQSCSAATRMSRVDRLDLIGLIEAVEEALGGPCDDPDVVERIAAELGLAWADLRA
jgi:hypothetical protein